MSAADDARDHDELTRAGVAHEESDVHLFPLLGFYAVLVVAAIMIHVIVWGLMSSLERPGAPRPSRAIPFVAEPGSPPPGPQFEALRPGRFRGALIQADPAAELREMRQREDQVLETWTVDPATGTTRMPIERAMEMFAAAEGRSTETRERTVSSPALSIAPTDAGRRDTQPKTSEAP